MSSCVECFVENIHNVWVLNGTDYCTINYVNATKVITEARNCPYASDLFTIICAISIPFFFCVIGFILYHGSRYLTLLYRSLQSRGYQSVEGNESVPSTMAQAVTEDPSRLTIFQSLRLNLLPNIVLGICLLGMYGGLLYMFVATSYWSIIPPGFTTRYEFIGIIQILGIITVSLMALATVISKVTEVILIFTPRDLTQWVRVGCTRWIQYQYIPLSEITTIHKGQSGLIRIHTTSEKYVDLNGTLDTSERIRAFVTSHKPVV